MSRSTIDFGIDLGTTNSAIAVLKGNTTEVFKNNESQEYTPSAVWIDRNNRLFVGRIAKERIEADSGNAFSEFKLQMGSPYEYRFTSSGRTMKPEELSAEVLKALKASVMQRTGEEVKAAVITVPAAFELHQNDATRKAAVLAGFSASPLLQEPIAAALAYGFQSQSDKVFWLVYDLGGGTFDAAVMQVHDGQITVVNHSGDNHLGGKLIDWAIVETLFVPALTKQYKLSGFERGNVTWRSAFAKLKAEAERAKILLSDNPSLWIDIPSLGRDEQGQDMAFEYELTKADVERLASPFILRSINTCKKVLAEKNLNVGNVEKVLLVGGPTLMPYLRERLTDKKDGLGIPVEFSIDPLTVVARGAAIFAGTQRLSQQEEKLAGYRQDGGVYTISFPEWIFQGNDSETEVAGIVKGAPEQSFQHYTIEFINPHIRPSWRSGKVPVAASGQFMTTLWVKRGEINTYIVELLDPLGRLCQCVTDPPELTYTPGMVISSVPLTHSIGVALANNEVEWFLEKGRSLPARCQKTLRTAYEVRQGQAGDVIRIPVVEGPSPRADRNRVIGKLEVTAQQVRRTVPAGSEVGITIDIDASRLLRTKANIPLLDEEFEEVLHLGGQEVTPDVALLRQDLEQQKKRLEELRKQEIDTGGTTREASVALEQIEDEQMVHDVEVALAAAQGDAESRDECDKRLRDLKVTLDKAEDALEWPKLVREAENLLAASREVINEYGSLEEKLNFQKSEEEIRQAMQTRNVDLLGQRLNALRGMVIRLLDEKGILPVIEFEQYCSKKDEMINPMQAQRLMADGLRAMQANRIHELRVINQQLRALLPMALPELDWSTLIR